MAKQVNTNYTLGSVGTTRALQQYAVMMYMQETVFNEKISTQGNPFTNRGIHCLFGYGVRVDAAGMLRL